MAPTALLMIHNPMSIAIGDTEEMKKAIALLDEFLVQAEARASAVEEALNNGDLKAARDGSHSLKGSANGVGAVAVGDLFARIETALKQGDEDTAQDLRWHIAQAFDDLRQQIRIVKG